MFTQLKTTVQSFTTLNDDEIEKLCTCFQLRNVPANTLLLEAGDIADEVYFINKGIIQSTNSMFTENQFAGIFDSLMQHTPSNQELSTVEDCELLVISADKLMRLYSQIPKISSLVTKIAQNYLKNNMPFE